MSFFSKLISLSQSRENRSLFGNTASLYILQTVNYIIPLISVPYLVRTLGTDNFGLLAFAGSLMGYFQIVVDYGFNLSATREISLRKNDREWLSNFCSSVLVVKMALVLVCAGILAALMYCVPRFHSELPLYLWP